MSYILTTTFINNSESFSTRYDALESLINAGNGREANWAFSDWPATITFENGNTLICVRNVPDEIIAPSLNTVLGEWVGTHEVTPN